MAEQTNRIHPIIVDCSTDEGLEDLIDKVLEIIKESTGRFTSEEQEFKTHANNKATVTDLSKTELDLADKLRDHDVDLERDSDIMKDLGVVYHEQGINTGDADHFIKASALYNSALLRTSEIEKQHDIKTLLIQNEKAFLETLALGQVHSNKLPSKLTNTFKDALCSLRAKINAKTERLWQQLKLYNIDCEDAERMQQESKLIHDTKDLCTEAAEEMKQFIRAILQECYLVLGPAPQKFATVGLGSLARKEMTPYSDLEFIIIIETEDSDKQYFRNLTNLLHLFVLNLGETPLPAVGVKSLNDFDKANGDWFYDKVTCNGFCLDGSMPWASKTPRGRPDRKSKKGIELIQTPAKMASFTNFEFAIKEGYHLAQMIKTCTLIDGNEELFENFKSLLVCHSRCIPGTNITIESTLGMIELVKDLYKYTTSLDMHQADTDIQIQNVKKEIYRLPTVIVDSLKVIYNMCPSTYWELLDEMTHRTLMSKDACHNVMVTISISILLRLVTYIRNQGQQESLSFLKHFAANQEKNVSATHFCETDVLIVRYYFTMIPLTKNLMKSCTSTLARIAFPGRTLLSGNQSSTPDIRNLLVEDALYDTDDTMQGGIYYKLLQYQKAINCFQKVIKKRDEISDEMYVMAIHKISFVYEDIGDYHEALLYAQQELQVTKQMHGDGVHSDMAMALNNIAVKYIHVHDYYNALTHFKQALEMKKQIYGNDANRSVASTLNNIAEAFRNIGCIPIALEYHKEALQMKKEIYGDAINLDVATSLNNIALAYDAIYDYQNALKYHLESLQIRKQMYRDTAHTELAMSLTNIAAVYHNMRDYQNALQHHLQALQMKYQIHGNIAHPDIALALSNMGSLYHDMGDNKKALEHHKQALQMDKQIHGDVAHSDIANTLSKIATAYKFMGVYDKALEHHKQSLKMRKQIHGDCAHPNIANILQNIAILYDKMKHYKSALSYELMAFQMLMQLYRDSSHPDVIPSLNHAISLYGRLMLQKIQK